MKANNARGLDSASSGDSFGNAGSRIAKPLRGGGGGGEATIPVIIGLQNETSSGKRSSWSLFGQK